MIRRKDLILSENSGIGYNLKGTSNLLTIFLLFLRVIQSQK